MLKITTQHVNAHFTACSEIGRSSRLARSRGYTLVELLVVLIIAATMTAVSVPVITAALNSFRLSSAVESATGAIASTRYQALRFGYPFQLTLTATPLTYQVASEPTSPTGNAVSFSNVGTAVPISASNVALNANTTFQFNPSGTVQLIAAGGGMALDAQTFTLSYAGKTATVTVSSVGYVTVQTQ